MSRFKSVQYDIDAVQWKGEVTPEIKSLFEDDEIVVKTLGDPLLCVPIVPGPRYAKVGEWVIRYPDGEFDVSDDEDFQSMYEAPRSSVDMDIGIPLKVVGPGGAGTGEIRVKVKDLKVDQQSVLIELARQIFAGIGDVSTINAISAMLIAKCDRRGLSALKDLITKLENLDGNVS